MDQPQKTTPLAVIAAAWVVVTLPLLWGVCQSVMKSRPLFQTGTSAPAVATKQGLPR